MMIRMLLLVCVICGQTARSADWAQFRGPGRAGISTEAGLARSWPADGPKVLWTVELGQGFAGAAVRGGKVYILDRVNDQKDVLRCLELNTGKELWTFGYEAPGTLPYNGSRNVPTVEEKFIFTLGPLGHLHCVDRETHKPVWSHHIVDDFKDPAIDRPEEPKSRAEKLARAQIPMWGVTQVPVLYKDLLIVAIQTQKVGLAAYDRATGKLRWTTSYIGRNWFNHASPYLTSLGGVDQVIMFGQPSDPEKSPADAPPANITSVNPDTGQILWTTQTPRPYKIPIPSPVRIADDRLFISGGLGFGCVILKVAKADGRWTTDFTHNKNCAAYIHTPILYKDRLYATSFREHGGSTTGLVCLDLNVNVLWQTGPQLTFDHGGMLIADDLVFMMHGKSGVLHLLEITPTGARVAAKAKVLEADGATVWAPLALSEGKLIVRDLHQMKCLDVGNPKSEIRIKSE